jgi:hypothetical protein
LRNRPCKTCIESAEYFVHSEYFRTIMMQRNWTCSPGWINERNRLDTRLIFGVSVTRISALSFNKL